MTEQLPFNISPLPVKLRVDDYILLDQSGAFDVYAKTELIEGNILFMNAQHRPHARIKTRLALAIANALAKTEAGLEMLIEPSVSMPPHNVPEPDIVLTSKPDGEGPIPVESVALIIEVSDATLRSDLGRKTALYARYDVPEYWVVDVEGRVIHQMWEPENGSYGDQRIVAFGASIDAMMVAGLSITTDMLG